MRKLKPIASDRTFTFDKFLVRHDTPLADLRDDVRIKRALQRAMLKERAPQSLIDAIRLGIRA